MNRSLCWCAGYRILFRFNCWVWDSCNNQGAIFSIYNQSFKSEKLQFHTTLLKTGPQALLERALFAQVVPVGHQGQTVH